MVSALEGLALRGRQTHERFCVSDTTEELGKLEQESLNCACRSREVTGGTDI